jgi:peptidoglycan hydrolase-like protein with peptidoglycan-binding domain
MNIKKIFLSVFVVLLVGVFSSPLVFAASGTFDFDKTQYAVGDKIWYTIVGGRKNADFCIDIVVSDYKCLTPDGVTDSTGFATGTLSSAAAGSFPYSAIFVDNEGLLLDYLGPVNIQIGATRPRIVPPPPITTVDPKITAAGGTTGDPCDPVRAFRAADKDKNFPTISTGSNKTGLVSCAQYLFSKVPNFFTEEKPDGPQFTAGKFDNEMFYWVRVFQNGKKLKVDGVVGPQTWAALGSVAGVDLSPAAINQGGITDCPAGQHSNADTGEGECVPNATGSGDNANNTKNTGLCGFLGEGYQEKNGLCFPPEVVKGSSGSIVASDSIGTLIRNIMRILLTLAGALAVLFIVIGSVMYTTAEGNEGRAKQGKAIITRAIIGLVGAALAYTIVTIVYNLLTSGSVFSG